MEDIVKNEEFKKNVIICDEERNIVEALILACAGDRCGATRMDIFDAALGWGRVCGDSPAIEIDVLTAAILRLLDDGLIDYRRPRYRLTDTGVKALAHLKE